MPKLNTRNCSLYFRWCVWQKIHQFQSSIKMMHTKEYWLLFFCVTVYCTHCWVTTVSPTRCQLIETPPEKNRATAIGNTPESLVKIERVDNHHHHLFAQINWPRRRSHDQHENKSRTRKAQKTGAYILPIKNKHTRYKKQPRLRIP